MNKVMLKGDVYLNCYFIQEKGECYIIDPGCDKEKILEYVDANKLQVLGILLTHAHMEHICALDVFPVPIYLHRKEYEVLMDIYNNGFKKLGEPVPYDIEKLRIILIRDRDTFYIQEKRVMVIHTPGHTVGSVCYKYGEDLYTGDTLYKGRVGRWDLPTGNLKELRTSVVKLMDSQPDHVRVHPSRGESTTIGEEKLHNYFYLEWKDMI